MHWILDFCRHRIARREEGDYEQGVLHQSCGTLEGVIIIDWRLLTLAMFFPKAATNKSIQWVPRARWVVDGNIWTSSGVTAGASADLFPRVLSVFLTTQWREHRVGHGQRLP